MALEQLKLMVMQAGLGMSPAEIMNYIKNVIDIVVQLKRGEKGVRFVSEIRFKALEDRKLHDDIQNAFRDPVKNFYFLLKQAGFQYVFFTEEKKRALAWINSNYHYDIVLFKVVASPRKKVIC